MTMLSVSLPQPFSAQLVVTSRDYIFCTSRGSRSAFLCEDELNARSVRCFHGGTPGCLEVPVSKTRKSTRRGLDHLSSSYQGEQSSKQISPTVFRNGIFINAEPATSDTSALIDIEDETDGSILFRYGGLEDIWELDKMLEFLCRGAFNTYNVESLVPVVVELLKVPISTSGQRRIVELLSSCVRTNCNVGLCEAERMVSQILAEATSEFLPPPTTGQYKGRRRPAKRYSSRLDKWWQKLDSFLGPVQEDLEFWEDDEFRTFEHRWLAEPLDVNGRSQNWNDHTYTPLKGGLARPVDILQTRFTWKDAPSSGNLISGPSDSLVLGVPSTLEFVTDDSYSRFSDGNYTAGVSFSSQVRTLEDVLARTEQPPSIWQSDVRRKPPPTFIGTLPVSSIRDMIEWKQEDVVVAPVSVPSRKTETKNTIQTNQRTRSRSAHQRVRSKMQTASSKSSMKKRRTPERLYEKTVFNKIFTLPMNHSDSGIASFLEMRKGLSDEILTVLNQGSVVLAGGGLAVVLHVAARMLSKNSAFDRYKLFELIRGASLIWLAAGMQKLRSSLLLLPPGCTVSNYKNKKQLLSLQHQLRTLSFKALAVMVLAVVGTGL